MLVACLLLGRRVRLRQSLRWALTRACGLWGAAADRRAGAPQADRALLEVGRRQPRALENVRPAAPAALLCSATVGPRAPHPCSMRSGAPAWAQAHALHGGRSRRVWRARGSRVTSSARVLQQVRRIAHGPGTDGARARRAAPAPGDLGATPRRAGAGQLRGAAAAAAPQPLPHLVRATRPLGCTARMQWQLRSDAVIGVCKPMRRCSSVLRACCGSPASSRTGRPLSRAGQVYHAGSAVPPGRRGRLRQAPRSRGACSAAARGSGRPDARAGARAGSA